MEKEIKYNEPWILQRADPYVYRHTDGTYYFYCFRSAYDRIVLRKSSTLNGLKDAGETTVWVKHDTGIMSKHIWAPELHYLLGKWYIYYAGGDIATSGPSVPMFGVPGTRSHEGSRGGKRENAGGRRGMFFL